MSLSDFCNAVFKRKSSVTNQSKFIQAVFKAAGSGELISDEYARKLFSGAKPISEPQYDSFPEPINREGLLEFLKQHVTPTPGSKSTTQMRCQEIANQAGISRTLDIEPDVFLVALTDWFEAIIHDSEHCDILESAYQMRLKGAEPEPIQLRPAPLHLGDRADVVHPPALQNHTPGFWTTFTHEWVIRNLGNTPWRGRKLVCVNPKDLGIRPIDTTEVEVPDCEPSKSALLKTSCQFSARGQEGAATSIWRMHDANGDDCFPNESSCFNVLATVVNVSAN
ncbi:MAG: NBR1-Ig-like domain-containing protein [Actinomyces sp.]|nr:NBR1-Ig-like domain-containing protein [Actinomyces sp.]MDU2984158.1 NBR1-Ig-like domain-containing protein [Actinomyces sp.]